MIRWGIMATGNIANKFADTVNGIDSSIAITEAVASRSLERAQEFAVNHGIKQYFGSYEELCRCDSIDAVYICTPNNIHYENCMLALSHGKHVLCEKPFAVDTASAEKIYRYAEEKGLFIMEGLWIYHLPLLKKTVEIINSGIIGEVCHIRADYGFTAEGARRERKFRSELAGGALLDVGIYNIGFVKMIYDADPTELKTSCTFNEFDTDKFGSILAEFEGGRTAVMTSSIGLKIPTEGVIYGTKGRIYFPDYQKAENMEIVMNDGRMERYSMPFRVTGFEYQIEECCRCIEQGRTESETYSHAKSIEIMKTLDAVREKWGMKFSFEK